MYVTLYKKSNDYKQKERSLLISQEEGRNPIYDDTERGYDTRVEGREGLGPRRARREWYLDLPYFFAWGSMITRKLERVSAVDYSEV